MRALDATSQPTQGSPHDSDHSGLFKYQRVRVDDGVELNVTIAGSGSPAVLLHGFPQTHLVWRHVAADLAADHTVIISAMTLQTIAAVPCW